MKGLDMNIRRYCIAIVMLLGMTAALRAMDADGAFGAASGSRRPLTDFQERGNGSNNKNNVTIDANDERLWSNVPKNATAAAFALKERMLVIGAMYVKNPEKAEVCAEKFLAALPELIVQCDGPILACEIEMSVNDTIQSGAFRSGLTALIGACQADTNSPHARALTFYQKMLAVLFHQESKFFRAKRVDETVAAGNASNQQAQQSQPAVARSSRPAWNVQSVAVLEPDDRLYAALPVEHHCAAVEIYARLILCFDLEPDEKKRIAKAGKFLKKLPELIKRCDGPVGDVWFRAFPAVVATGLCKENSLLGYLELVKRYLGEMPELVQIIAQLKIQGQTYQANSGGKKAVQTYKRDNCSLERWSVPNACWVLVDSDSFVDPSEPRYDAQDLHKNLFETCWKYIVIPDEDTFIKFLGDLERHVNYPKLRHLPGLWIRFDTMEMAALKSDSRRGYIDCESRIRKITAILEAARLKTESAVAELKYQDYVQRVEDPIEQNEQPRQASRPPQPAASAQQSSSWWGVWGGSNAAPASSGPKITEVDDDAPVQRVRAEQPTLLLADEAEDCLALSAPDEEDDDQYYADLIKGMQGGGPLRLMGPSNQNKK